LIHANLTETRLQEATLTGSELSNIEARGCSLTGADLRGATFNNLDPRTMDLTGIKITLDQALMLLEPLNIEISMDG
ncbi:MAG: pentapeptide repeat-containing protein, partial [Gammaproteobacteria bacterium]|nr:pentapeptide repeat-containing protein [Gammaproteobacteria bacterium]